MDRRDFLRAAAGAGLMPLPAAIERFGGATGVEPCSSGEFDPSLLPPPVADYPLRPVRFDRVDIRDEFWRPRMDANREVSLHY